MSIIHGGVKQYSVKLTFSLFSFLLILTLFLNFPWQQIFYNVSFCPRRPLSQSHLSSCFDWDCMFSRYSGHVADSPNPFHHRQWLQRESCPLIRLSRHPQWGCSQTAFLKFQQSTTLPIPSSIYCTNTYHFIAQLLLISSPECKLHEVRKVCLLFLLIFFPSAENSACLMKESNEMNLLETPSSLLETLSAKGNPHRPVWANELWGNTCWKRKTSPFPTRYE